MKKSIGKGQHSQSWWIPELYRVLYRRDWLMDINRLPHMAQEAYTEKGWASKAKLGQIEFFYGLILAKEILRRLEVDDGWYPEFSNALWAQSIVADQWFRNVQLKTVQTAFDSSKPTPPANDEGRGLVEMTRRAGDRALEVGRYDEAIELYSMAIGMDPTNATTRCQKVRALLAKGIYAAAVQEASVAVRVVPKSMWAWHYLGLAYLQAECFTRAKTSFEKALALVESGRVPSDLREALTKTPEEIASGKAPFENKQPGVCWMGVSTISQQQIEGIIRFAEEMQWPYLNEVREHALRACDDVSTGKCWIAVLQDWFCGLSLPGARFAHNIMPALIFCSPSRPEALEYYCQFEGGTTGVVFQDKSYWRVRSVAGRVLGCLPGITLIGGWTGPCAATEGVEVPRTIYLAAKQLAPVKMSKLSSDQVWESPKGSSSASFATRLKEDEQWIVPLPPSTRSRDCKLLSVRLGKLPVSKELLEIEKHEKGWDEKQKESRSEFRAHICVEFGRDGEEPHHEEYTLLHNSIFITLPPCLPGQNGVHKEHVSRVPTVEFAVEKFKEHPESASMDETLIINATGEGTEVAARAWCAQVGRHAIVRKDDGPCMACTLRDASRAGLGMGTVIWVS
jgi:tetratricopeptide (TPR) repeat protein